MSNIKIYDRTLVEAENLTFKERVEIARQLEKLGVNAIELGNITENKVDELFIKTISSFVKKANISVKVESEKDIENASKVIKGIKNATVRIELPLSPVGMEYTCHKKAPKMLEYITVLINKAKEITNEVEFSILDATRAEKDFLLSAIKQIEESGVNSISIYDNACEMLPDEMLEFVKEVKKSCSVSLGVCFSDLNGMAISSSVMAIKYGVDFIKGDTISKGVSILMLIKNICDNNRLNAQCTINKTELNRIIKQIERLTCQNGGVNVINPKADSQELNIKLDKFDTKETVKSATQKLGYDLTEEDITFVYEEFLRVAEKKMVGAKELDAIVASCSSQVPATYKLVSYIINSGNTISSSSQMTILKGEKTLQSACLGDGPIDASFKTLEQIIGRKFELDDFQIQSITEGKEAMGSALIKLRANGKVYSGNGISTDIIGASIRAYISAVNKIVYEEK